VTDAALRSWRARCAKVTDAEADGFEGVWLAVHRTRSCFRSDHAVKVLERTPDRELLSCEEDGFRNALTWLREEVEKAKAS
jgi:hypothetical protein